MTWITKIEDSGQESKYWMPDVLPEPSERYNFTQQGKQYVDSNGNIKMHPLWTYENKAYVDDEYLLYNEKLKLLIDEIPDFNSRTKVAVKNSADKWIEDKSTVKITYTIRQKTDQEINDDISKKWLEIKKIRNEKLEKLDHVVHIAFENNLKLSKKFIEYRQELRDISETFKDPYSVVWPDELSIWEYYEA